MNEETVLQVLIWSPEEPENRFRAKVTIKSSSFVNITLLNNEQLEGSNRQLRFRNILCGIDEGGKPITFMMCKKGRESSFFVLDFGTMHHCEILAKFCLHGCYLNDVNNSEFISASFKIKGFYPWYNKTISEERIGFFEEDKYHISNSFHLCFSYSKINRLHWGQRHCNELEPYVKIVFDTPQSISNINNDVFSFFGFLHLATLEELQLWDLAFHTQDHREIKISGNFNHLKERGSLKEDIFRYNHYAFSWKDLSHEELESVLRSFYSFVSRHRDGWEQYWAYVNGNESLESKFLYIARCLEKFASTLGYSERRNREKYAVLLERIEDVVTSIGIPFSQQMIARTVATRNMLTHGSSCPKHVNDEVTVSSELLSLTFELQRFAYLVIMKEIGFPIKKLSIRHTRLCEFGVFSFEMSRATEQEEQIIDFNCTQGS